MTQEKKWKPIVPGTWKYEKPGDSIEGILVSKGPKPEDKKKSAKYFLENPEGKFLVWGSALLDELLSFVKIGQEIRIVFKGKKSIGQGKTFNQFSVDIAEGGQDSTSTDGLATPNTENLPKVEDLE